MTMATKTTTKGSKSGGSARAGKATAKPAAAKAMDRTYDAIIVCGDINGGIQDIRQLVFRPWPSIDPYHVGDGLYLCSSSTPPGGGVHGMSGMLAARSALRRDLR